jgi:AAA15 family ATPase/GTPase
MWSEYTTELISSSDNKMKVLKFLQGADFKISNIETTSRKVALDDEAIDQLKLFLSDNALNSFLSTEEMLEISTFKKGIDESGSVMSIPFNITNESDGTRKFYELAGPFIDMLSEGKCLVYDELDTKLHSNLMLFLIKLFNLNKKNAQMMFTTHNIISLDQQYLRRDQIYLMNLLENGSSELYSLLDFSDEKTTSNIAKRYLTGRYSAIPYVDEELVINSIMEIING